MNIRFDNQVCVVTGAGSGIGFTCAKFMAESGAKVAMIGRNPEKIAKAAEMLADCGEVKAYALDVSDVAAIPGVVEQIRADLGEIRFLIQAAGIMAGGPGVDLQPEEWDRVMNTNAKGLFFMMQQVVKQSMLPQRFGAIVNIASMAGMTGIVKDLLSFLGTPIIALAVGTIFAVIQLSNAGKMDQFYNLTNDTLKTVGPILFVTAAGGVLGKVIASSDMVNYITQHATVLQAMGIFFPFVLSAILKSAQGSSTVALTTTAGIVAPLLPLLGLDSPVRTCLACMAIGAGAMTVSHANDSFFWVVTNFGAMTPEQGYKTQTINTLVLGVAAMIEIFLLSLFLH